MKMTLYDTLHISLVTDKKMDQVRIEKSPTRINSLQLLSEPG